MAAGITDLFVGHGLAAKAKVIVLGSSVPLSDPFRSLNVEHVSPTRRNEKEISRRAADPAAAEQAHQLELMRRWFFARKPDAGFVLTGFPATLLQAKVLDEWMEVRDEALTAVVAGQDGPESVIEHYRTLGLITEAGGLIPA